MVTRGLAQLSLTCVTRTRAPASTVMSSYAIVLTNARGFGKLLMQSRLFAMTPRSKMLDPRLVKVLELAVFDCPRLGFCIPTFEP